MAATLFLDRDGTIIYDRGYLGDPAGVELLPGAGKALGRLVTAGWQLIGVTNQSGIGRGYFTLEDAQACNRRVDDLLAPFGGRIAGWYLCPHAPGESCACRKPAPGMVEQAMRDFPVDAARSLVVGDKPDDVALAVHTGMRGLLVETGEGARHAAALRAQGVLVLPDLAAVADHVLKETAGGFNPASAAVSRI